MKKTVTCMSIDGPLVDVEFSVEIASSNEGHESELVVRDLKIGSFSQMANFANFLFPLIDNGNLEAIFGQAVVERGFPNIAILGFDCEANRRAYLSLQEAVEAMASGKMERQKNILIRPGQKATFYGRPQLGGQVTQVRMLPDVFEALGTDVDISVSVVDLDVEGTYLIERPSTKRFWSGRKSNDNRAYVLDEADMWPSEEVSIEIRNHSFHRPISWLEFIAVMAIDPQKNVPEFPRFDGHIKKYRRGTLNREVRIRVLIESPYAGDVEKNLRYLRAAMRDCFNRGEAPFASHGLYTQEGVLKDGDLDERRLGIEAGFLWGLAAEKTVVYSDLGISAGMCLGILQANNMKRPVEYRKLDIWT